MAFDNFSDAANFLYLKAKNAGLTWHPTAWEMEHPQCIPRGVFKTHDGIEMIELRRLTNVFVAKQRFSTKH